MQRILLAVACLSFVCSSLQATPDETPEPAPALVADAAERADWDAVAELLAGGAEVNAPQVDGMTALHWAAWHDDPETVAIFIKAGANVLAENRYGVAPLAIACQNGSGKVVRRLLKAGADAAATLRGGETALMIAARTGRPGPVKALLRHGANANAADRKGQTALMWAAAEGNAEVVDALLAAGADAGEKTRGGFTAFYFAIREGRSDATRRLLAAGADVNDVARLGGSRTTPLLLAVENGHFELAIELLEAGADPNGRPRGYTPLHAITWVRKPIRGDGDPSPIGSGAVSSLEFVRRLASFGADLDARLKNGDAPRGGFTTTGSTPFVLAARSSDVPLLKVLLELGADPNITNEVNTTALLAAAGVGALGNGDESAGTEAEALETVRFLVEELGADVNAVDDHGETAMHGAVNQNRFELIDYLADRGADVAVWNRPNSMGWTPLEVAYGRRPGNFRPVPESLAVLRRVMLAAGVEPPELDAEELRNDPDQYSNDQ